MVGTVSEPSTRVFACLVKFSTNTSSKGSAGTSGFVPGLVPGSGLPGCGGNVWLPVPMEGGMLPQVVRCAVTTVPPFSPP